MIAEYLYQYKPSVKLIATNLGQIVYDKDSNPLVVNPSIVDEIAQNIVTYLNHKKNNHFMITDRHHTTFNDLFNSKALVLPILKFTVNEIVKDSKLLYGNNKQGVFLSQSPQFDLTVIQRQANYEKAGKPHLLLNTLNAIQVQYINDNSEMVSKMAVNHICNLVSYNKMPYALPRLLFDNFDIDFVDDDLLEFLKKYL